MQQDTNFADGRPRTLGPEYTDAEKWEHRASIRQAIISKLEKKNRKLEEEIRLLRAALETHR